MILSNKAMKKKIRIKTVLTHLFQRGWKLHHTGERFHVLKAPDHFNFQPDPYFSIPQEKHEETDFYYDYLMGRFATLISEIYELNKTDLIKLSRSFGKTAKDIKADMKEQKESFSYVV